MCLEGFAQDNRFGAAPTALGRFWDRRPSPAGLGSRLAVGPTGRAKLKDRAPNPGLVPRLRRSDDSGIDVPALPDWADVWQSALRAGRN
jgi:hypothetical protein